MKAITASKIVKIVCFKMFSINFFLVDTGEAKLIANPQIIADKIKIFFVAAFSIPDLLSKRRFL